MASVPCNVLIQKKAEHVYSFPDKTIVYRANVGPTSATLAQHQNSIGPTTRVCYKHPPDKRSNRRKLTFRTQMISKFLMTHDPGEMHDKKRQRQPTDNVGPM